MKKIIALTILTICSNVNASTHTDRNGNLVTEGYSGGMYYQRTTILCKNCEKPLQENVVSGCGSNSGTMYPGHEHCKRFAASKAMKNTDNLIKSMKLIKPVDKYDDHILSLIENNALASMDTFALNPVNFEQSAPLALVYETKK